MNREDYVIDKLSSKYIGDDAAIIGNKIYSMDAFFEDIHFKREWMSMYQIGRKAMLVNLSDAIAMNADPKYALVTLSLPKYILQDEIDEILDALESTAAEFNCEIIGGDTIAGEKLHLSITIISESDNPLKRAKIEEGDFLAYTGKLGESKRDLERLMRGESIDSNSRFYEPQLRGEFIKEVRAYINAGMDISDGLFCDTNKLLATHNFSMELLEEISEEVGKSGEEYEMLISFSSKHYAKVEEIAKKNALPLTLFAKVLKDGGELFKCENHHF